MITAAGRLYHFHICIIGYRIPVSCKIYDIIHRAGSCFQQSLKVIIRIICHRIERIVIQLFDTLKTPVLSAHVGICQHNTGYDYSRQNCCRNSQSYFSSLFYMFPLFIITALSVSNPPPAAHKTPAHQTPGYSLCSDQSYLHVKYPVIP